jgi:hypothetical protein
MLWAVEEKSLARGFHSRKFAVSDGDNSGFSKNCHRLF